jgi:hypothetical protein
LADLLASLRDIHALVHKTELKIEN